MITLLAAALVAAQPAPAPVTEGHMLGMKHEQHESMKEDCCKDCCKDMAKKHEGHAGHEGHTGQ